MATGGAGQRSGGGAGSVGRLSTVIFAVIALLLVAVTVRSAAGVAMAPSAIKGPQSSPTRAQVRQPPPAVPAPTRKAAAGAAPGGEITFGDGADDKDVPPTPVPRTVDPNMEGGHAHHHNHNHPHPHVPNHTHGAAGDHSHSHGGHHHHHGPSANDKDKALWTSTAPLPSGAGIARIVPGDALTEFAQIHHGIYRCQGKAQAIGN